MLKLTTAVLAVALAGSAGATGWRSLRIDGSSEASFTTSVAQFAQRLPRARYQVLLQALRDVWRQGTQNAAAEQGDYSASDYLLEIDGLTYEQVVTLTDPTGNTSKTRLRTAIAGLYGPGASGVQLGRQPTAWSENQHAPRTYPPDNSGNPHELPPKWQQ